MQIRLIAITTFLLASCTPNFVSEPKTAPSPSLPVVPTQVEFHHMTPVPASPEPPNLQNLIETAKEDLAQRLSIPANQIGLVETTEVEWSDSSLDCPQPGMAYLQVITPGYRILLEADGQEYEYHSNRDAYVVFCENRTPPFIPQL